MSEQLMDARPRIRVNDETIFQRMENARDSVYDLFQTELNKCGIIGEVTKSVPFDYDTWVLVRLWRPEDGCDERTFRGQAKIKFTAHPGHRHAITMIVGVESRGRRKFIHRVINFSARDALNIVNYLSDPKKKLSKSSFSRYGLVFDRNKAKKYPGAFSLGLITKLYIFMPFILGGGGYLFSPPLGAIVFVLLVAAAIKLYRGQGQIIVSTGRPEQNPRDLIRMDSWQAVIVDFGSYADQVKNEVKSELINGRHESAIIDEEEVAYLGPFGKSERIQLVVNFRRAIAFIEIHQYGNDLYIDWEAYLNLGVWSEIDSGVGYEQSTKNRVIYKDLIRDLEALNEYDLSDANFLIEWVHASQVKVLKRLQKEKIIDQEFDFKIQRSDRSKVLEDGQDVQKRRKTIKRKG